MTIFSCMHDFTWDCNSRKFYEEACEIEKTKSSLEFKGRSSTNLTRQSPSSSVAPRTEVIRTQNARSVMRPLGRTSSNTIPGGFSACIDKHVTSLWMGQCQFGMLQMFAWAGKGTKRDDVDIASIVDQAIEGHSCPVTSDESKKERAYRVERLISHVFVREPLFMTYVSGMAHRLKSTNCMSMLVWHRSFTDTPQTRFWKHIETRPVRGPTKILMGMLIDEVLVSKPGRSADTIIPIEVAHKFGQTQAYVLYLRLSLTSQCRWLL